MDSDQDVQLSGSEIPSPSGIGKVLKAARLRTGKDLPEVSQLLRIRQPYLAALEEGRHKDLPGVTYAVGFLRTYAEFLDLDGEDIVRQFRQEAAGDLNRRAELVFPSPVSEGRIPGGAVLFLGLFLAAIAYGGWYWVSSKDGNIAELVPALPDRLAGMMNRPANVTAEKAEAEPEATPAEPLAEPAPAANEGAASEGTASEAEPVAAAAPDDTATATDPVAPPAAASEAPAAPETPPAAAAPVAPIEQAAPVAEQPVTEQPVTESVAEPAATAPKVIGAENVASRVQIKAVGDECWIQIREMDGQMLQSRLLRDGDSYLVPDRPGLTLMVGNAGALEIRVDGKVLPPLGGPGQVRRDIKLDADSLLAR